MPGASHERRSMREPAATGCCPPRVLAHCMVGVTVARQAATRDAVPFIVERAAIGLSSTEDELAGPHPEDGKAGGIRTSGGAWNAGEASKAAHPAHPRCQEDKQDEPRPDHPHVGLCSNVLKRSKAGIPNRHYRIVPGAGLAAAGTRDGNANTVICRYPGSLAEAIYVSREGPANRFARQGEGITGANRMRRRPGRRSSRDELAAAYANRRHGSQSNVRISALTSCMSSSLSVGTKLRASPCV